MPVRRVGGGGRAVGVRRPTVVVAPRMPIAPMMMTGMMTGMMMGSMMAGRRSQAASCHHEETSTTIVIVQPFPGTVVAFHPEDGKVMFQTIPIGVAIPHGCHVVKTPEQVGVPILIKQHGKIEYKLIPPGGNVPHGAKIIQIQLQQQPPPPPPGSTIVQIVQPDGQVAYQAIPPGYPIPPGAVIVQMPQPMENNNNNNNDDHHHDQDKGLDKVDNSNLPTPLPSPYGEDELVREFEVKEGQEEVHRDIQVEPNNGEIPPVIPNIDNQPYPGQVFSPQPQPYPQQMAYPPVQGYPPPQGAYPQQGAYPPPQGVFPPQPYPQQMAYPPVQGYPPPQGAYPQQVAYPPQQPYASQVQPRPQSQQFPPNQYQAQQPPRPQSQQIPSGYQSQQLPPQPGATKTAPVWVPDVQCASCSTCNLPFTFKRRRHHCRNCGKIYCESCSHSMCMIPEYGFREAVRVCDQCYETITGRKPNPVPPSTGDGCIIS